jgi:succinate dehydrogenase / fumarate reductase flavoprotein subunit
MSTVPGLFAAGECAAGLHGANRLGGNSLSDLLVFGKRAGEYAARFAREHGEPRVDVGQAERAEHRALEPFGRTDGEGPFQIQQALQNVMQENVGIVRRESEMTHALEEIDQLAARAERVAVVGNREYNPGWHTALDLRNLLTVARAVAIAAIERKESRGGHFRDDYAAKDPEFGKVNLVIQKDASGHMTLSRVPIPPMPAELAAVIKEMG